MIHLLALLLAFPFFAKAESLAKAMEIARKGLEQNVVTVLDRKYLLAGSNQYHSLWAWDFAFASYGALRAGNPVAVRDSFEIYFSFQRPDGLMPRVIDRHGIEVRVLLGLMGIVLPFKDPLRPQFETENGVISYIPNVIFPWSASRYILDTKDTLFARKYFTHAEKAIAWMDSNTIENGLVCKQQPYSDWEDSVQRTGCVAFTNVLYALSLRGLSDWAKFLGDQTKTKYYLNRYNQFLSLFLLYFWDSNKKIIRNFTGDDHLTADANLLAVAYHLLNQKDSEDVLKVLRGSPLWKPWPGRPTWPNYPDSIKSKFPKLVGLSGYHDEIHWGWITALAAIAEKETGHLKESQQILESYAKQIVADGTVYEVYDFEAGTQSLKPVSRLFYQAEQPFTWSSGFFLEAAYH